MIVEFCQLCNGRAIASYSIPVDKRPMRTQVPATNKLKTLMRNSCWFGFFLTSMKTSREKVIRMVTLNKLNRQRRRLKVLVICRFFLYHRSYQVVSKVA